jgi:MFS family permease
VESIAIPEWVRSLWTYYDHTDIFTLFTANAVGFVLGMGILGVLYGRYKRRPEPFNIPHVLSDFGGGLLITHATILFGCAVCSNFILAQKLSLGMGIAALIAGCNAWHHFSTIGSAPAVITTPPSNHRLPGRTKRGKS